MSPKQFGLCWPFLVGVYLAACCLIYVYKSLWIGTLVVFATVALLSLTTIHAHRINSISLQLFSVVSLSALACSFGFFGETTTKINASPKVQSVYNMFNFFRGTHLTIYDSTNSATRYMQSPWITDVGMGPSLAPKTHPHFLNAIRLAICWLSLAIGGTVVALACTLQRLCNSSLIRMMNMRSKPIVAGDRNAASSGQMAKR